LAIAFIIVKFKIEFFNDLTMASDAIWRLVNNYQYCIHCTKYREVDTITNICYICLCSYHNPIVGRTCKIRPSYVKNKNHPLIKQLIKYLLIPDDIIIYILIPMIGTINDMCDYHMTLTIKVVR